MQRRRPIIERLLQKPLLSILAEREEETPEAIMRRWREEYPDEAVSLAMKMANNWLKKVSE